MKLQLKKKKTCQVCTWCQRLSSFYSSQAFPFPVSMSFCFQQNCQDGRTRRSAWLCFSRILFHEGSPSFSSDKIALLNKTDACLPPRLIYLFYSLLSFVMCHSDQSMNSSTFFPLGVITVIIVHLPEGSQRRISPSSICV